METLPEEEREAKKMMVARYYHDVEKEAIYFPGQHHIKRTFQQTQIQCYHIRLGKFYFNVRIMSFKICDP